MNVRYTKRALQQVDVALAYVHERSSQGADSIRRRLIAIVDLLKRHPYAGRATSRRGVLRISLTPYRYVVDYRVSNDDIVIQRFRHTARRPLV